MRHLREFSTSNIIERGCTLTFARNWLFKRLASFAAASLATSCLFSFTFSFRSISFAFSSETSMMIPIAPMTSGDVVCVFNDFSSSIGRNLVRKKRSSTP